MNKREFVVLCLSLIFLGGVAGWSVRVHTSNDRYITGVAARYEAEAGYLNKKTNLMIQANKGDIARGRKNDDKKKN